MAEGEVETLDLTDPALLMGSAAAGDEVRLELVEATHHGRTDMKYRAADARVLVHARGSVRSPAVAELNRP